MPRHLYAPLSKGANELQSWTWTRPETFAKLEHYRSFGWIPPNYNKSTLRRMAVVERYWYKYAFRSQNWRLQSYQAYWRRLSQYFSRLARHELRYNAIVQVGRHLFPAECPVPHTRPKETLDIEEQVLHQRFLWRNSSCFRFGNYIVQQSTLQLWSSITGTRPGVILEDGVVPNEHGSRNQGFKSQIPYHISFDSYCPILQIVAMAFRDNAFENENLTPEFIRQLRVPCRLPKLPIRGKKALLKVPVLRNMNHTAEKWVLDPILSMKYSTSDSALKHISEGLGYELLKKFYFYRRWAANEINLHYVASERRKALGYPGNKVFERHYQSNFIGDLQEFVQARPPQKPLSKAARRSMRDALAPNDIKSKQKKSIRRHPKILKLRAERDELAMEIRSLAGPVTKGTSLCPILYRQHKAVSKVLMKKKRSLYRVAKKKMKEDCFHDMPNDEINKQIEKLLRRTEGNILDEDDGESEEDSEEVDWEPPYPNSQVHFSGTPRNVDTFYGPDADTLSDDASLCKRIQATKDMIALCDLQEPPRLRDTSWNADDSDDSDRTNDKTLPTQEQSVPSLNERNIPTKACIICPDQHEFSCCDSLRRHIMTQHLSRIAQDSLHYNKEICKNIGIFNTASDFLNHAAKVHNYDLKFRNQQLKQIAGYVTRSGCARSAITKFH
ncbi:hypothetical protein P152DRAFT_463208 [Eremomyces bilateralis CBS 781.70]|uniref:Uncharacterized protein n=1 Tax=Eremomyces bilateralis CBS 781.70 TaxID=1392243 RepID=A0A6G1GG38_9PEZI|nr:uncharacterized protein P152DRAFT_463208 [Eremomyces bilateralis CBS 781.70]KAF1816829.1 hypothetical protein P152DRAFT_463208 [Eremomyces bilateralis CBS 781.70]